MILKKKILVLTPIYIGEDIERNFTPVVHYFTKEWIKEGHEVIVIHNIAYYPIFFYLLGFFFRKIIASLTGTNIPKSRITKYKHYVTDKVSVYRMPMFKLAPHFKFSNKNIFKQTDNIYNVLNKTNFEPDIIIGHWSNPQLELITRLKNKIPGCRTCMVMHDDGSTISNLYKNNYLQLISSIDVWGYRSLEIKRKFELHYGVQANNFICTSGLPKRFTNEINNKIFQREVKQFLFVGTLIKRKYPTKLILAIDEIYKKKDFKINFIGEGQESRKIKRLSRERKLSNCVILSGFQTREKVQEHMRNTECFIMISKAEAYGLVYLEAMGAGCIVIASRNEGIDGVIVDGYNGFLCEAGDEKELAEILRYINKLNEKEKLEISKNAFNTAKKLTDELAAKKYLEAI